MTAVTASANRRARSSSRIAWAASCDSGTPPSQVRNAATTPNARAIPSAPPAAAGQAFSARRSRISRQRLAPSAARTAISRSRRAARARSRFATLPQAIRSTTTDGPSRPTRPKPERVFTSCSSVMRLSLRGRPDRSPAVSRAVSTASCERACSRQSGERSRTATETDPTSGLPSREHGSGIQISVPAAGYHWRSGRMPTIVKVPFPRRTGWPRP